MGDWWCLLQSKRTCYLQGNMCVMGRVILGFILNLSHQVESIFESVENLSSIVSYLLVQSFLLLSSHFRVVNALGCFYPIIIIIIVSMLLFCFISKCPCDPKQVATYKYSSVIKQNTPRLEEENRIESRTIMFNFIIIMTFTYRVSMKL